MRASSVLPRPADAGNGGLPAELRDLALAVRRIGCGLRNDPETIALAKDAIASRLAGIARWIEKEGGHASRG